MRDLRSTPPPGSAFVPPGVQRAKSIRLARISPDIMQRLAEAGHDDEDGRTAVAQRMRPETDHGLLPHDGESAQRFYSSLPMPAPVWRKRSSLSTPSPPEGRVGNRALRGGANLEPLEAHHQSAQLLESMRLEHRHASLFPSVLDGSGTIPLGASGPFPQDSRAAIRSPEDGASLAQELRQQLVAAQGRIAELAEALRQQKHVQGPESRHGLVLRAAESEDLHLRHVALLAWRGAVAEQRRQELRGEALMAGRATKEAQAVVEAQNQQLKAVRQRAFQGGKAWAVSVNGIVSIRVFAAWRAATQTRRAVSALQTKLFGEMAYRSAALDAQKRELEVRFLEEEAEHRETVRRLRAELADGESRHAEALKRQDAEAAHRLAAAENDFTQALRQALVEPEQKDDTGEDVSSPLGSSHTGSAASDARLASAIRSLQNRAETRLIELETRQAENLQTERDQYQQLLAESEEKHSESLRRAKEATERRVSEAENRHAEMIRELQQASDQRLFDLEMRHTRTLRALQGTLCEDFNFEDTGDSMGSQTLNLDQQSPRSV